MELHIDARVRRRDIMSKKRKRIPESEK